MQLIAEWIFKARSVRQALAAVLLILALSARGEAQAIEPNIGIGVIGLDASHLASQVQRGFT